MFIHAIAFSLPDKRTYHVAHAHVDPNKCEWSEGDREHYYQLLDLIENLHRNPGASNDMKPSVLSAYKPEGVTLSEALQRVVPYYVTADRKTKNTELLEAERDTVNRVKEAGIGVPHGIDFYALVKHESGLEPTPELIQRTFRSLGRKGHEVQARNAEGELLPLESWAPGMDVMIDGVVTDLNSKEFRRYPMLISVTRSLENQRLVTKGKLKVVPVPNEVEVDLVSNRGGEIIRERSRTWK